MQGSDILARIEATPRAKEVSLKQGVAQFPGALEILVGLYLFGEQGYFCLGEIVCYVALGLLVCMQEVDFQDIGELVKPLSTFNRANIVEGYLISGFLQQISFSFAT